MLYKKLRPAVDTHHVTYEEASSIVELLADAGRDSIVDLVIGSFGWWHGYVAYRVPGDTDDVSDEVLLTQILKIIGRKGTLAQNLKNSLDDDVIDADELTQIESDIQQCITALMELKGKVKAMHEQPAKKLINDYFFHRPYYLEK